MRAIFSYIKIWLNDNKENSLQTKTIKGTVNPAWNENLEITSNNLDTDVLNVCLYNEGKEGEEAISDIIKIPIHDHQIGDHFSFDDNIKYRKKKAGSLHFELDFNENK